MLTLDIKPDKKDADASAKLPTPARRQAWPRFLRCDTFDRQRASRAHLKSLGLAFLCAGMCFWSASDILVIWLIT